MKQVCKIVLHISAESRVGTLSKTALREAISQYLSEMFESGDRNEIEVDSVMVDYSVEIKKR